MAVTKGLKNDVLRLRKQKLSYDEIAKRLNCAKSTVQFHCSKHKLTDIGKTNHPVSPKKAEQIFDFCLFNSISQAEKFFGLSRSTIRKYRNRKPTDIPEL